MCSLPPQPPLFTWGGCPQHAAGGSQLEQSGLSRWACELSGWVQSLEISVWQEVMRFQAFRTGFPGGSLFFVQQFAELLISEYSRLPFSPVCGFQEWLESLGKAGLFACIHSPVYV